ncbi:MAG TPA: hypothetical protein VK530_04515 [Candidatus Acidoferrum sp.]|nr:hypothetical protein [Candidatus Acidoferrum sp.]
MKALHHRALALTVLLILSCGTAVAQTSPWLTHDASWRIEGRELIIDIAYVANPTAEESGPLFLSIYAQPGIVYDGGAPGQLLGRAPIESIAANGRVDNLSLRTRVRAPRPGLKFTALMLERQNGKKFTIVDWVAFTSLYAFPRKQAGGVGSLDSVIGVGDISVTGGGFTLVGRRAQFSIERLQNQRELNLTGTLRLAFYATSEPYLGGFPDGKLVASRVLGQLAPGDFFRNLGATLPLKAPRPRGEYYISMFVEEEQEDGFVPMVFISETGPQRF